MPEIEPSENRGPCELPLRIITDLEQDNFVREQLEADAGVWEGYSIKEHTLMAMTQFEKYFSQEPLPLEMSADSFRKILAVHDIGKARAIAEGDKKDQHKYTLEYIPGILQKQGLSENEIRVAQPLLSGDPIGSYLKSGDIGKSKKEIEKMAGDAGAQPAEFFKLLKILYMVDAGSYTEDATIEGVVQGKKSLDHLFEFDHQNQKMDFSPDTKEKISVLENLVQSAAVEPVMPQEGAPHPEKAEDLEISPGLTPELREQIVNEHLIDVQAYEGLLQYTQVANVESVLSNGIVGAGRQAAKKWGSYGQATNTDSGLGEIYLTFKKAESSFSDWESESLPWSKVGPVAILLKAATIDKLDLHVSRNEDWNWRIDEEGKKHLSEREGVPTFRADFDGKIIPKEDIEALVLSPLSHTLERKKGGADNTRRRVLKIAPEQLEKIAISRANRLATGKKREKNLVPIYNSNGDMVWPRQISHEEVKELIAAKEAKE